MGSASSLIKQKKGLLKLNCTGFCYLMSQFLKKLNFQQFPEIDAVVWPKPIWALLPAFIFWQTTFFFHIFNSFNRQCPMNWLKISNDVKYILYPAWLWHPWRYIKLSVCNPHLWLLSAIHESCSLAHLVEMKVHSLPTATHRLFLCPCAHISTVHYSLRHLCECKFTHIMWK